MHTSIFLKSIMFLSLFISQASWAKSKISIPLNFGSSYEFGLFPTSGPSTKTKHQQSLPSCEDVKNVDFRNAPGVNANQGYCYGEVSPEDPEFNNYALIFYGEYFNIDGELFRILERNPLLMTIAQFLKVCIPLGGVLDPDGFRCEYRVSF